MYEKPWTRDCAINTWYAAALLIPEQAKNTLWATCEKDAESDLIIQNDNQWWDKLLWVFGAWEYYVVSGDIGFLEKAFSVAKNSFRTATKERLNKKFGLFYGPAVMADGISGYPEPPYRNGINDPFVLCYEGVEKIMILSTNCVYYKAAFLISKMAKQLGETTKVENEYKNLAEEIKKSINKYFWDESKNNYKYIISDEGYSGAENDKYTEAIGISLAVLFDIATEEQKEHIFKNTFVDKMGIPLVWPHFKRFSDEARGRHNVYSWPIVSGFWALAAAKCGANDIFNHEMEAFIEKVRNTDWNFYEVYHSTSGEPEAAGR